MQIKGLRTILVPVFALTLSAACRAVLADKEQLSMFTRGWPEGALLEFINFAPDTDHGQDIVRQSGFVPVHATKN